MKKTLVLILIALFAIGVVACKPKADNAALAADTKDKACAAATATADKTACPASGDIVAEYQKFADDYVAAYKKMKGGDMSAVQDFQALSQKAQDWAKKVQESAATLTAEQQKKIQEIGENIAKALQAQQ